VAAGGAPKAQNLKEHIHVVLRYSYNISNLRCFGNLPSGSFAYGVYDKESGEYARPKAVFPVEMKQGGSVGCEPLAYTTGKYEFKIYIDNVLTAVLPFEVR
jgi:hypothetical protein